MFHLILGETWSTTTKFAPFKDPYLSVIEAVDRYKNRNSNSWLPGRPIRWKARISSLSSDTDQGEGTWFNSTFSKYWTVCFSSEKPAVVLATSRNLWPGHSFPTTAPPVPFHFAFRRLMCKFCREPHITDPFTTVDCFSSRFYDGETFGWRSRACASSFRGHATRWRGHFCGSESAPSQLLLFRTEMRDVRHTAVSGGWGGGGEQCAQSAFSCWVSSLSEWRLEVCSSSHRSLHCSSTRGRLGKWAGVVVLLCIQFLWRERLPIPSKRSVTAS